MTSKQTALFNTAKMVGVALIAGAITSALLAFVPLPYIGLGVCVIVMLYLVHMIYEMELSKAEHLEALNKLNTPKG